MVYNSIIEALSKLGGIKEWISIHVKINMPDDKRHELYFSNSDYIVVEKSVEVASIEPAKPVVIETLREKIQRMRFGKNTELTPDELAWWQERQRELEANKIGQIFPEESMEAALKKLAQIGVK